MFVCALISSGLHVYFLVCLFVCFFLLYLVYEFIINIDVHVVYPVAQRGYRHPGLTATLPPQKSC